MSSAFSTANFTDKSIVGDGRFRELRERLMQELNDAVERQLAASQEQQEGSGI